MYLNTTNNTLCGHFANKEGQLAIKYFMNNKDCKKFSNHSSCKKKVILFKLLNFNNNNFITAYKLMKISKNNLIYILFIKIICKLNTYSNV